MSRTIRLPQPEAGAEREVIFMRRHGCPNAKFFRDGMEDDQIDLLVFPVGIYAADMPANTPFVVKAQNDCAVCGATVQAWFELYAPRIFVPGVS